MTGKKYNFLTVLSFHGKNKWGQYEWLCLCDCGNKVVLAGGRLRSGNDKSCGKCNIHELLLRERCMTHGLCYTKEYQIWKWIKQRCYDKNAQYYDIYGGRGIVLYEPWINDPKAFYDYLLTLPETREQFEARTNEKATIDRINSNGNYEPGNLRWASWNEQSQNREYVKLNECLVKSILWEYYVNKICSISDIIKKLNVNCSYSAVLRVINKTTWTNINIDKELEEYRQFGTVNGIAVPK
jgi:hypothetical protein